MSLLKDLQIANNIFKSLQLTPVSIYAKKRGMTRQTIYNWIKDDKLPNIRLGGIIFIIEKYASR